MKTKNWIELGITIFVFYFFLRMLGVGCPIKYITGVPCAGCGMTRAYISILQLDISKAFHYHPLFWVPPIGIIMLLKKDKIPKKIFNIIFTLFMTIFVVVYFARLFNPDDTIVKINFSKSMISHILNFGG